MAINVYTQGELIRLSASFIGSDASPINPGDVFLNLKYPTGASISISGSSIINASPGIYQTEIDASLPGRWHYRWYSTGCGQAAKSNYFKVLEPHV